MMMRGLMSLDVGLTLLLGTKETVDGWLSVALRP